MNTYLYIPFCETVPFGILKLSIHVEITVCSHQIVVQTDNGMDLIISYKIPYETNETARTEV